jgi:hypothetical protein
MGNKEHGQMMEEHTKEGDAKMINIIVNTQVVDLLEKT